MSGFDQHQRPKVSTRNPHTASETRRAQLAVAQAALTGARGEAEADCRELLDMLGLLATPVDASAASPVALAGTTPGTR